MEEKTFIQDLMKPTATFVGDKDSRTALTVFCVAFLLITVKIYYSLGIKNSELHDEVRFLDDWSISFEESTYAISESVIIADGTEEVLDFEIDKERISLGIKQLVDDPIGDVDLKKGSIVTCTVINTDKGGIDVEIGEGFPAFIKRNDLSMDKSEQDPSRFEMQKNSDRFGSTSIPYPQRQQAPLQDRFPNML